MKIEFSEGALFALVVILLAAFIMMGIMTNRFFETVETMKCSAPAAHVHVQAEAPQQ